MNCRRIGGRQERGRRAEQKQSHTAQGEERKMWSKAPNTAGKTVPEEMILDLAPGDLKGAASVALQREMPNSIQ